MHGQAVVVALDPGGIEGPQEDAVGADEGAREYRNVRVRLLDRRVGGSQDRGVALGFFRAGEVVFVGLVGLVPDLDRGQARAVALGEEGDEGGVGGRVASGAKRWRCPIVQVRMLA